MGERGFAEETKANVASDDRCQEKRDNETLRPTVSVVRLKMNAVFQRTHVLNVMTLTNSFMISATFLAET